MNPNNLINSNNTFENDPSIEDPKDINLYLPNALSIYLFPASLLKIYLISTNGRW